MNRRVRAAVAATCCMWLAATACAEDSLKPGKVSLKNAGALAFGPEGILFVADAKAAVIYAIDTGDNKGEAAKAAPAIKAVDAKVAAALGTAASDILINDMVVNPASGGIYLSVSRGRGPDTTAGLVRNTPAGKISELELDNIAHAQAKIPNPPEDREVRRGRRSRNSRTESITDLEFQDGRLLVAGLSNEEFASTFRSIPFPFTGDAKGASVEIYHGAHGGFETRSPIRTFTTYEIEDKPHLLAGYTCTPLVKFPLDSLKSGAKVRGVTIAELGNRNRPLDMFVYTKGGQDYILMANSARGLMKITTNDINRDKGIVERISGTAGQKYETIESQQGIVQLDRLNETHAAVLVKTDSGIDLRTLELP